MAATTVFVRPLITDTVPWPLMPAHQVEALP
jgi:hypothetical protein